jgi:hypothetical protein
VPALDGGVTAMTSNDDSTVAVTGNGLDVPDFLQRQPSNAIEILPPERREIKMPDRGARLAEIAVEIKNLHGDVCDGLRQNVPKAIRIGELLTEAKDKARHGDWLAWVESHCSFSADTAQLYMKLFRHRAQIAELLKTEPVRFLTFQEAAKAVSNSGWKATAPSKPSKPTTDSEKRIKTALAAMHDCEPAERRRVVADPGIRESMQEPPAGRDPAPDKDDPLRALVSAWDVAPADVRTRFVVEKEKEIAAARPKPRRGRPPGSKNKMSKKSRKPTPAGDTGEPSTAA